MAGNYPDKSYFRIPWDGDGTYVLNGSGAEQPDAYKKRWNSRNVRMEYTTSLPLAMTQEPYLLLFPVPMDIFGIQCVDRPNKAIFTSTDTSTGVDGTWVSRGSFGVGSAQAGERNVRLTYNVVNWLNTRAVRVGPSSFNVKGVYLWGSPSSLSIDKLMLWKTASDARIDPWTLDFGDVRRGGSSVVKTFRVKNCSDNLAATSPLMSFESINMPSNFTNPTLNYPDMAQFMTFSTDGSTYNSTATLGDLGPGEISPTVYARLTVPVGAQLGLQSPRIRVAPAAWAEAV